MKGGQAFEFFHTDFLTNIFPKNVYTEHLWLCDNENSYIFEMSYDDIWQGSVRVFSNIRKIKINV